MELARRFVEHLGSAVVADENATAGSYRVTSLYYDTAALDTYWEKLEGEDPRTKFRIRYYRAVPAATNDPRMAPAAYFVEAKHRHDQLVSKTRVQVPATRLTPGRQAILDPGLRDIVSDEDLAAAEELDRILLQRPLSPFVTVSYTRQPYIFHLDRNVRITIDTDVRALSPAEFLSAAPRKGLSILPAHMAVVEIKFYWSMPHWLAGLAVEHGLELRRFSKYASALEAVYPTNTSRSLRLAELKP